MSLADGKGTNLLFIYYYVRSKINDNGVTDLFIYLLI